MHSTIESLLSEVNTHGSATAPIEMARDAIARSNGKLTWSYAGKTWATVVVALPGVQYPSL